MFLVASSKNNILNSVNPVSNQQRKQQQQQQQLIIQKQTRQQTNRSRELEIASFRVEQHSILSNIIKPLAYLVEFFIGTVSNLGTWLSTSLGPWIFQLGAILNRNIRSSSSSPLSHLQFTIPKPRISPITSVSANQLAWTLNTSYSIGSFNEDNSDDAMDMSRGRAIMQRANSYSTTASTNTSTNNNNNNNHLTSDSNGPYYWQYATISPESTHSSSCSSHHNHQMNLDGNYADRRQLKGNNIHQSQPQRASLELPMERMEHSCCLRAENSNLLISEYPGLQNWRSHQRQFKQTMEDKLISPVNVKSNHKYGTATCAAQPFSSIIANGQFQEKQTKQNVQPAAMHFKSDTQNGCSKSGTGAVTAPTGASGGDKQNFGCKIMEPNTSLVLVSKTALSDLTDQIAFSMSKMRDLEERVKVIPDLQRRLEHVINDGTNFRDSSTALDVPQATSKAMPARTPLDCGCQSFRDHLRYNNSINRDKRHPSSARTYSISNATNSSNSNNNNHNSNNVSSQLSLKVDASTNTILSMDDVITRDELDILMSSMQRTCSILSPSVESHKEEDTRSFLNAKSPSITSPISITGSVSGPKSSTTTEGRTDSCESGDIQDEVADLKSDQTYSVKNDIICDSQSKEDPHCDDENDEGEEEEEGEEEDTNTDSMNGEEPYSLGSSYQDPSDFEEYCAYGESLDRRTKDFMSNSTKITNDLRFALIRLNDYIKRKRSINQIESSSGCVEVIRKAWFDVAARKDSQASKAKFYIDYLESFTKQLLNTVVNLTDSAGNTAMHYAASHYKLDIIDVLLNTKVCDVNSRNRAGYTPIMLLALTEIDNIEDQDVARQLFSMGDVNIKARSNGQTALMLASSHGRVTTCKLLLECGADPSLQDFDGSTALMCGSEQGHEDIVRCLLAHRLTDPTTTDNDGLDALKIAMNNGHKGIGLILYAAKNVPRMTRSAISLDNQKRLNDSGSSLGASMRRSRAKPGISYVRRADSLLGSRGGQLGFRTTSRNM